MTAPLKVGVIGLGNMGRHHVRIYSEVAGVTLTAVCDPVPPHAQDFADRYHCDAYTEIDRFLDQSGVEAISITSPTNTHFALAQRALNRGIHVLVEKPICETVAQADTLIALADKQKRILTTGHIERFNPAVLKLIELVTMGELGEIISLAGRRASPMPTQIKDANVFIDLAVHDIDIFCILFKSQPLEVVSQAGRLLIPDREDHAELFLRFPTGSAYLSVNWITPIKIRTLSVTASKGYAELDYIAQRLTLWKNRHSEESMPEPITIQKQEPLRLELAHFVDCVRHQKAPLVSAKEGRDALAIALGTLDQFHR